MTGSGATSITTSFGNANANTFLANNTSASGVPTFIATSSIFGTGAGGQVLAWNNGVPQWIASTTYAGGAGISTSFANGQLTITNTIGYPFLSNATSTLLAFNGGLTTTGATSTGTFAVTGSTTISSLLNVGGTLNANGGVFTTYASTTQISSTGNAYLATSGGNVGVGTTSPFARLSIFAGGTYGAQPLSTLFAIGSTTAGTATSTLFSVNSTGSTTLFQVPSSILKDRFKWYDHRRGRGH